MAICFLVFFIWATKNGQFDDDYAPSVRILFEDSPVDKSKKQEQNGDTSH
jgi:cbb3-type cytochrome oxidase maturation protein